MCSSADFVGLVLVRQSLLLQLGTSFVRVNIHIGRRQHEDLVRHTLDGTAESKDETSSDGEQATPDEQSGQ